MDKVIINHENDHRCEITEKSWDRIQAMYERYHESGTDLDFEALIREYNFMIRPWLSFYLSKSGLSSDNTLEDVMQEMNIKLWEKTKEHRQTGQKIDNFYSYAKKTTKNLAIDMIRKSIKTRKNYGNIIYLDKEIEGRDGSVTTIGDITESIENEQLYDTERAEMFRNLLLRYCRVMMNAPHEPKKVLALCYSRIITHIFNVIPQKKGASIKEAIEIMGERNINELSIHAERTLSSVISGMLMWGREYLMGLDKYEFVGNMRTPVKDIIYTKAYDKSLMDDWSSNMHKYVMKDVVKHLCNDTKMMSLVREYEKEIDCLSKVIQKQEGKKNAH